MQLFLRPSTLLCAAVRAFGRSLGRWLNAPKGAHSCTKPPKATERCMLRLSATSGCTTSLGLL
eukprot:8870272-Alexandrium_andersonii.AAC.1